VKLWGIQKTVPFFGPPCSFWSGLTVC